MLLVEDNPDLREVLEEVLRSAGYEVDAARDGREALDLLVHIRPPELILLDLRMPRMDGRALLRELRASPRLASVPVILMSGERANDIEGVRWVRKPVDPEDLLRLIEGVLHPPSVA
jgi:CheY-like chemotaxis protein